MRKALLFLLAITSPVWAQTSSQSAKGVRKPDAQSVHGGGSAAGAQLVEQARQQLQAGDAQRALAIAQQARRADASSYKPPYYIAYALMQLGDLEGAAEAQHESMNLARTEDQKSAVRTLGAAITANRDVRDADKAAQEGFDAKAARLYKAAFDAGLQRPEIGLKAAKLYEDRLKDVATAVRILRDVQERFPGTASASSAGGELARLKPALGAVTQDKLRAAHARAPGSRRELLEEALATDPGNADVLFALANDAAFDPANWPQFESRIKTLLQRRLVEEGLKTGKLRLRVWQGDPRLIGMLEDAWGPEAARQALREHGRAFLRFDLAEDNVVKSIVAGGPAQKGGLQQGDLVVAVGGVPVGSRAEALREVARLPASLPAALDVRRSGQTQTLYVAPVEGAHQTGDCLILASGYNYQGECKDGLAHGAGRANYKNAAQQELLYVGGFKEGLYHGHGTATLNSSDGQKIVYELMDGRVVKKE